MIKLIYLFVFELVNHSVFTCQGVVYYLNQQEWLRGSEIKIEIKLKIQVNGLLNAVWELLLQVIGKLLQGFQNLAEFGIIETET